MKQPHTEFGFYATIPRLVRAGYKDLTAVQKWLYVCLKDLCGDHGTCYRSLRTLSEETGISTGMLSESIRKLHEAGLIHAEKKKRSEGGKDVWHITMADIWIANGKAHPSKRSQSEQTLEERSQNEVSQSSRNENVQQVNENLHTANDKGRKPSPAERERSLCETEERTERQEHLEARGEKEEAHAPASSTPEPSFSLSSSPDSLLKKLTDEQADFWRRWATLTSCTDDALKESMLPDIAWLAERITTTADLDSLYQSDSAMLLEFTKANGKTYTAPHLKNLVRHYPKWRDAQDTKQKHAEQASQKAPSGTGAVRNWTAERLAGSAPPLVYAPPPERKRPGRTSESMGIGRELAAMREKLQR